MSSSSNKVELVDKKLTDYTIHWVVIAIKLIPALIAFLCNLAVRKLICPFVVFWHVRRYIECIVNLISMKFILVTLGFFRFDCEGFRFFSKESSKITLRSGFIGVGNHNSIIDYIYYSYIANPVFVKILIYKKQDKEQTFYCPLSFLESVKCALSYRGFDPIVIHNEKEFKQVKYRKMTMKTLISECFEQLNGPIFIMLPGINPNEHVCLNKQVSFDIYDNEIRFERSLVGFYVKTDPRLKLQAYAYKNQLFVLLDQMVRIGNFSLYINAIEFRRMRFRYDRVTYSTFVDRYYLDHSLILKEIDYEQYLDQMDQLERDQQKRSKAQIETRNLSEYDKDSSGKENKIE